MLLIALISELNRRKGEKMAEKSFICNVIHDNPDEWEEIMEKKNINIKREGDLAIFNYITFFSDFSDPVVQEARGIIVDVRNCEVVCWPFRKFGNWNESYVDPIDWDSAVVQEKIDGSIIKLYYYAGTWKWATNSVIFAENAMVNDEGRSFLNVIMDADNYKDIPFEQLDITKTYIFELVSPETTVVIPHQQAHLYHLSTRSSLDGAEFDDSIGVERPRVYGYGKSLDDYIQHVRTLNPDEANPTVEGFVVCDKDHHRIKIKSPEYLMVHKIVNTGNLSEDSLVEVVSNRDEVVREIIMRNPELKSRLDNVEKKIALLEKEIEKYISYVRGLYEEVEHDRKAVAAAIRNDKYADFGFAAIGNNMTAMEMIEKKPVKKIRGLIKNL